MPATNRDQAPAQTNQDPLEVQQRRQQRQYCFQLLIDRATTSFTDAALEALTQVFIMLDTDRDEVLSPNKLNELEYRYGISNNFAKSN